jgi:hypothetical protein
MCLRWFRLKLKLSAKGVERVMGSFMLAAAAPACLRHPFFTCEGMAEQEGFIDVIIALATQHRRN